MYAHDREIRQKIMYKSSDLILYPIIRAEFSFKMTAISRSSKDNGGLGSLVHNSTLFRIELLLISPLYGY